MERVNKKIDLIILCAIDEDLNDTGDITSESIFSDQTRRALIVAKSSGIIAGLSVAERVFYRVDPAVNWENELSDGSAAYENTIIARIEGSAASILKAERIALNFLQRLSGIATQTSLFVRAVEGTGAVILDTRKTTPGLRVLEKYAVRCGGGQNHRMGLYDMILIKDNHIDAAGSISEAVRRARAGIKARGIDVPLEVETRNLDEVKEALKCKPDRIMLDNMKPEMMREAVGLINNACETEASGNISLSVVRHIAETGVNFISVGALTHSVTAMDLSLRFV